MGRTKVIVNPISGRGAGARSIPFIDQTLRSRGLDLEIVKTERPWHAAELASQAAADGYAIVVAVGGDGTANEVLNGLMQAREKGNATPLLGVLPVGRGNDFGFGVGIPHNLPRACDVLLAGRAKPIDVGFVCGGLYPRGRYFGNGVGIGFDAVVGFEALKMKPLTGFLSYIAAALKTIYVYARAPQVKIVCDGEEIVERALMVSIMNGRRLGGGFMMAPHARPDDGTFDICIAEQVPRARILALIPRFMQGTQEADPAIQTRRAKRVTVTALDGVLPAHADGETLCTDGRQLTIELYPSAISIIS